MRFIKKVIGFVRKVFNQAFDFFEGAAAAGKATATALVHHVICRVKCVDGPNTKIGFVARLAGFLAWGLVVAAAFKVAVTALALGVIGALLAATFVAIGVGAISTTAMTASLSILIIAFCMQLVIEYIQELPSADDPVLAPDAEPVLQ